MVRKKHVYTVNPEFNGIGDLVWKYLNTVGEPIHVIQATTGRNYDRFKKYARVSGHHIWHNKVDLDRFVADSLGVDLDKYGTDKARNPLYKAIANEIRYLRMEKLLIDYGKTCNEKRGIGVWRLDKTKLDKTMKTYASNMMQTKNFGSIPAVKKVLFRNNQGVFRKILQKQYDRCLFCGFRPEQYTIGAHIVPYSKMQKVEPNNSMHPENGLLLCRLCDVAFERGHITVEDDYDITKSKYLTDQKDKMMRSWLEQVMPNIKDVVPHICDRRTIKYPPSSRYLQWKREMVATHTR